MKRLTIDEILKMPIGKVASLDPEHLYHAQLEAADELRRAKMLKEWLDSAVAMKYEKISTSLRNQLGKTSGTIHFNDGDYVITHDVPKKPEWDQALLKTTLKKIEARGDDPDEFVDVTYRVSERSYAAWPNSIRALFEPARILKLGKPVFTIKTQEVA